MWLESFKILIGVLKICVDSVVWDIEVIEERFCKLCIKCGSELEYL